MNEFRNKIFKELHDDIEKIYKPHEVAQRLLTLSQLIQTASVCLFKNY